MNWDSLVFWESGEWQFLQEELDDLDKHGIRYNPKRENLFAALDACPFETCKVCILGQDPYPDASSATGIAFSVPPEQEKKPPTLVNILAEYASDLHYPFPRNGDLTPWTQQGVLLWNVVPTCFTGKPGSHRGWTEWSFLTLEIVQRLSHKKVLFVALGALALEYVRPVLAADELGEDVSTVLSYSHPSPLGVTKGKNPFRGSRMFSTINDHLCKQGKGAINWKLD
jgi:uracil-DNA glycosylase